MQVLALVLVVGLELEPGLGLVALERPSILAEVDEAKAGLL